MLAGYIPCQKCGGVYVPKSKGNDAIKYKVLGHVTNDSIWCNECQQLALKERDIVRVIEAGENLDSQRQRGEWGYEVRHGNALE